MAMKLTEPEKEVLRRLYALEGGKRQDIKDIGKTLGLPPILVYEIECSAISKLVKQRGLSITPFDAKAKEKFVKDCYAERQQIKDDLKSNVYRKGVPVVCPNCGATVKYSLDK